MHGALPVVKMVSKRYDYAVDASHELHALLERIGNLLRQELRRGGGPLGLQPVQIEALHYVSLCNRYSDTPQGVADYLGLTKGTVSQTLKVLESRGLLRKTIDPEDRRVVHLSLTEAGRRVLEQSVPPALFADALGAMPAAQVHATLAALRGLLGTLQHANERRVFGVCRSCRFHTPLSATRSRCELIGTELSTEDAERICREHEAA
jgi:MarR family transcriptional regulator, organic hydroperoxide resistance regulator